MVKAIKPQKKKYHCALILGALAKSTRSRFTYLNHLIKHEKISLDRIYFLVGQRPLFHNYESKEVLLGNYPHSLLIKKNWKPPKVLPQTETEAAQLIVDQTELADVSLKDQIYYIDTPMQKTSKGSERRPNTTDTVIEWLSKKHKEILFCRFLQTLTVGIKMLS